MSKTNNQKIADAIRQQISTVLGSELDPGFVVIRDPSGFAFNIQYSTSAYWNPHTLAIVDRLCKCPGDGTGELTGGSFSGLFADILAASDYVTGTSDAAAGKSRLTKFTTASNNLVTRFEADFAPITSAEIQTMGSVPPTKLQYIADYVAKTFPGSPPAFPPSMAAVASVYANWLNLSNEIARASALKTDALAEVGAAETHIRQPDASTGALQTALNSWGVAYVGFPDNGTIGADLTSSARTMTVSVTLENAGHNSLKLTLDHQTLKAIPMSDLKITLTQETTGQTATLDQLWATASKVEMDIAYAGLTVVEARPQRISADIKTGWYSASVVHQLASKSGQDVSGLQLSGSTFSAADLFGQGKRFARVRTFVISQDPTITLRFYGTDQAQLLTRLSGNPSAQVQLGQIASFGAAGADYAVRSTDHTADVVTVVIAPATPTVTVPPVDQKAHIIGGVVEFPA